MRGGSGRSSHLHSRCQGGVHRARGLRALLAYFGLYSRRHLVAQAPEEEFATIEKRRVRTGRKLREEQALDTTQATGRLDHTLRPRSRPRRHRPPAMTDMQGRPRAAPHGDPLPRRGRRARRRRLQLPAGRGRGDEHEGLRNVLGARLRRLRLQAGHGYPRYVSRQREQCS